MSEIRYRRRGTAIVETKHGILLTAGRHGKFELPGGGAERGESRFIAAFRELTEETGLLPYAAEIIFRHRGEIRPTMSGRHKFQNHHTVCLVKASGTPRPNGKDVHRIDYYYPRCNVLISTETEKIIERYYEWKKSRSASQERPVMDEEEDGNIEDADDGSKIDYDGEE